MLRTEPTSDPSPEFKKFRELAGLLVSVPKSEVQEKMVARTRKNGKRKKHK
jgi:hypothetical protein